MESAVEMWESRVLCEISKGRWKWFCDFHGTDISTAVSSVQAKNAVGMGKLDRTGCPRTRDRISGQGVRPP